MGFWAKGAEVARGWWEGTQKDNPNIEYNDAHQQITASITAPIIRDTCAYLHSHAHLPIAQTPRRFLSAAPKALGSPRARNPAR